MLQCCSSKSIRRKDWGHSALYTKRKALEEKRVLDVELCGDKMAVSKHGQTQCMLIYCTTITQNHKKTCISNTISISNLCITKKANQLTRVFRFESGCSFSGVMENCTTCLAANRLFNYTPQCQPYDGNSLRMNNSLFIFYKWILHMQGGNLKCM